MSVAPDVCCPKFDASQWTDGENAYKIITWDAKPFVKDGTWCLYYVPLAFGRAMTRALKKIEAAGAEAEKEDFMVLSDCRSPWKSDVFVSVAPDNEIEGAVIEKISGDFLAKAFKGDYSNIGKWMKEMRVLVKDVLEGRGSGVDVGAVRYLFYYPTCPKCAKKHGENHVVIMAKLN